MGRRSKVSTLPPDLRGWVNTELIRRGFAGYEVMELELHEKGHPVSKSALQRYGSKLEWTEQLRMSSDAAQALLDVSPDKRNATTDAALRMATHRLFQALQDEDLTPDADGNAPESMALNPHFIKALSTLARTNIMQKDWAEKVRAELDAKVDALEKASTDKPDALSMLEQIRKAYRGVV